MKLQIHPCAFRSLIKTRKISVSHKAHSGMEQKEFVFVIKNSLVYINTRSLPLFKSVVLLLKISRFHILFYKI